MGNQFCSCETPNQKQSTLLGQKSRITQSVECSSQRTPQLQKRIEDDEPPQPEELQQQLPAQLRSSSRKLSAQTCLGRPSIRINRSKFQQTVHFSPTKTVPPVNKSQSSCCGSENPPLSESTNLPQSTLHYSTAFQHHHKKVQELKLNQAIETQNLKGIHQGRKYNKDDFQILMPIGEGGFGYVQLVHLKKPGKQGSNVWSEDYYAMKKIPKKEIFRRRMLQESLINERKFMAMLKNRFIVGLFCAFQDPYNCYFVMEYAAGGDVYSLLNNKENPQKSNQYKSLGQGAARYILASVILAIEFLHSQKIMYRDLKPQNVLIFQDGSIKLADFGLAKISDQNQLEDVLAGTKIYYAPEMLQNKSNSSLLSPVIKYVEYNMKVDFWTLGVFLHELIFAVPPFHSRVIIKGKFARACSMAEDHRTWRNSQISEQAKALINDFLRVDPNKRLGANGFQEIKEHMFFQNFDWHALENGQMVSPLKQLVKKFPLRIDFCPENEEQNMASFSNIVGFTYKTLPSYQKQPKTECAD